MQRAAVAQARQRARALLSFLRAPLPSQTKSNTSPLLSAPFATSPHRRHDFATRSLIDAAESSPVSASSHRVPEAESVVEDELEAGDGEGEALWAEEGAGRPAGVEAAAATTSSFRLRPYQIDCVEAVLKSLREDGVSRIGVSSPTGSGKTTIFTTLIQRLPPLIHPNRSALATRVLVIVGSVELARQACDTIQRTWPDLTVEMEQGSKYNASGTADVTVATYQASRTLSRNDMKRLDKFDPASFKAVIVDEAHHAVAKSYLAILARFDSRILTTSPSFDLSRESIAASPILAAGVGTTLLGDDGEAYDPSLESEPVYPTLNYEGKICTPIVGFTATFGRADGLALGKIFEKICWHGDWLDMIRSRWLSPLAFVTVQLKGLLDGVEVSSTTGDFVQTSLARAVGKTEVVSAAVAAWISKAQGRRSTLVFATNIEHVMSLTNGFRAAGFDARWVYEGTPPKERVATLAAFRALEFPILVNCGILTEGADFPAIDTVLLARPTRSKNLYLQMIGRGLRNSPETNKTGCLVIDLVGNTSGGIICAPTLFGVDPSSVVDGDERSTEDLEALAESRPIAPESIAVDDLDLRYKHFASVFDLARRPLERGQPPMSRVSDLAWVGCGNGTYVLELIGSGYVRIDKIPGEGRDPPSYVAQRYGANFGIYVTKAFMAEHRNLPTLVRTVDAALYNDQSLASVDLRRYASWRKSPSTPIQQALIGRKLSSEKDSVATSIDAIWIGRSPGNQLELAGLNRGQASDIICRLKNGGLGHWRKIQKAMEREEKRIAKERKTARFPS